MSLFIFGVHIWWTELSHRNFSKGMQEKECFCKAFSLVLLVEQTTVKIRENLDGDMTANFFFKLSVHAILAKNKT